MIHSYCCVNFDQPYWREANHTWHQHFIIDSHIFFRQFPDCQNLPNSIRVTCLESIHGNLNPTSLVALQFRLLDVKNIEPGILGLGRTDPFIELQKKNVDPVVGIINWITAYRSEHVHDNLNPVFKSFELTVEDLCYADEDWPLRMVVYDWQKNGKHRMLGMAQTSLSDLLEKKSKGGNADRSSAMSVTIEGTETAIGLIVVLESNVRER